MPVMRLISATMLRDLLLCERKLALDFHGNGEKRVPTSPFVQMLWKDGLAHEEDILGAISGPIADLRNVERRDRTTQTSMAIAAKMPTIIGAVLCHDDLVGMPDVLRLTNAGYVAFDVKAGSAVEGPRSTYKQAYLVQVAHYAHLLSVTGQGNGEVAGIIDRNGDDTLYDLNLPLGRNGATGKERHLFLLETARAIDAGSHATIGALAASCAMCDWRAVCREELRSADDLTLLAGLGRANRDALSPIAAAIGDLAAVDAGTIGKRLPGIGAASLDRFVRRARLWIDPAAGPIAYSPLRISDNPHAIDFDVEADPMRGLVYLHGFWHDQQGKEGEFVHFFAPTLDANGERIAFATAIDHFRAHRSAHWFHYSQYERTAYAGLQRRHPSVCSAEEIEEIFHPSRCTDLYKVIARQTDWPLSSYGIKSIAKSVGFSWSDIDPGGAASIEWFDAFARTGDLALRERIVAYNRDDVIASKHVRDALTELDSTGTVARFSRSPR